MEDEAADLLEVESEVQAHRDELENLMQKIDDSQGTVDALREQISDTEIEISHIRQEIAELRRVKQMRTIEGVCFTECPDFDVTLLNPEHRDHLNELLDRIYDLEHRLERKEEKSGHLNAEVDALARENEDLEREIQRLKASLEETKRDRKHVRNSIENGQQRLKELGITIKANKQNLTITESAIQGLIGRQDTICGKSGGIVELEKSIKSLEEEISREQDDLDQTNGDTERIHETMSEEERMIKERAGDYTGLLNWNSERENLRMEIKSVTKELEDARKENEKETQTYSQISKRLRELTPLFTKWEGKVLPEVPSDDRTVDALLAELSRSDKKMSRDSEDAKAALERILIDNQVLEEKIRRKQEELDRNMALFSVEIQRLKGRIEDSRTRAFEEEQALVSQIQSLKLKIAQQKANKQPL